jgi:hypothetical protein
VSEGLSVELVGDCPLVGKVRSGVGESPA